MFFCFLFGEKKRGFCVGGKEKRGCLARARERATQNHDGYAPECCYLEKLARARERATQYHDGYPECCYLEPA
jgi:hypothetical protein